MMIKAKCQWKRNDDKSKGISGSRIDNKSIASVEAGLGIKAGMLTRT